MIDDAATTTTSASRGAKKGMRRLPRNTSDDEQYLTKAQAMDIIQVLPRSCLGASSSGDIGYYYRCDVENGLANGRISFDDLFERFISSEGVRERFSRFYLKTLKSNGGWYKLT